MARIGIIGRMLELFGRGDRAQATSSPYSPENLGAVGVAVTGSLPYGLPPARGSRELAVAGKREPWLFAVTDKVARSVSAVPWVVGVARDRKGVPDPLRAQAYSKFRQQIISTYEPARRRRWMRDLQREMLVDPLVNHPLQKLMDRPNPLQSGTQFRALLQRHLDLSGEVFAIKERNAHQMPVQMWPVPNFWCRLTPYFERDAFLFSYGMFMKELASSEVIWLKHLDLENPYARGMGPGFALADVIETYAYALKTEKAYYYNNGVPPAIISAEGVTDKQLQVIQQDWNNKHGGYWNAMKLAWVNFKLSIQQLTPKFVDAQMLEQQNQKRDTLIQVYGVPPEVLGIGDNSNKAKAVTARSIYAEEVLVPRLEDLRDIFTSQLVPDFDDALVLEYLSPVVDDRQDDIATASKVPNVLTVNEWRDLCGFEPLEGPAGEAMWAPAASPMLGPPPGSDPGEPTQPQDDKEPRALPTRRSLSTQDIDSLLALLEETGNFASFTDVLAACIADFGSTFLEQVREAVGDDVPDAFMVHNPKVEKYLLKDSAKRVSYIQESTREALRQYLAQAFSDGKSIDEMVEDLESDTNLAFGEARSELIARTEIVSASNFGTLAGYQQSGVVDQKGWMATPGTKGSRESHEALDGTVIALDEYFTDTATGAKAMHPGGFGDPASDCNCRCSVYAVIADPEMALRAGTSLRVNHAEVEAMRAKHELKMARAASKVLDKQRAAIINHLKQL